MRRALGFLLLVALIVACFFYWKHWKSERDLADGEIQCVGCMSPERKAEFLKENAGEDADGQSEHKTTRGNISAGGTTLADPQGTSPAGVTGNTAPGTQAAAPIYPPATPATTAPAAAPVAANTSFGPPPATDTIAPNPPNGMTFAGRGAYQWYRQGNLTWRVDTTTGRSCIAFATDEEWRKPRVLAHGCGGNA